MRRLALVLALLAASSDAGPGAGRGGGFGTCPSGFIGGGLVPCTPSYAFFEFAPASGAGMGAPCACAAVTGAKGEAVTFTRASTATCTKTGAGGLATTGIANGDLVTCASGQPRVEYDGAGSLGLLVEEARTNRLTQSQDLSNAAYSGAATATANFATAPDGTTTATRVVYTAVNGNYRLQADSTGGIQTTASVYLRGTSGAGSVDFCHGGGAAQCVVCAYDSTQWSRCVFTSAFASSTSVFLGCDAPTKGSACSAGGDVLAWGLQHEVGAFATSYIPTTTVAVTRVAEQALTVSSPSSTTTLCIALTAALPPTTIANADLAYITSGASVVELALPTPTVYRSYFGSTALSVDAATAVVPGSVTRFASYYNGTARAGCVNGTCTSTAGAVTFTAAPWTLYLGGFSSTSFNSSAIVSRVRLDPSPTGCR